jgi:WD40 repeat protein
LAFSTDGRYLAAGTDVSIITIWDIRTGQVQATLQDRFTLVGPIAFSGDGKLLVSCGCNRDMPERVVDWHRRGGVTVWNVENWTIRHELREKRDSSADAAFSPDGRVLAVACTGDPVTLWDVDKGRIIRTLPSGNERVTHIAFSPDGKTLATSITGVGIKLFDVETLKDPVLLPTRSSAPVFSPDSRTLAISADKNVELWSVDSKARVGLLEGHEERVSAVAFSPGGKILATGGRDKTIRFWDVATGKQIAVVRGHKWGGCDITFSPDGTILASGGGKFMEPGEVFLWDVGKVLTGGN